MRRILIDADYCMMFDMALRMAQQAGWECLVICDTSRGIRRNMISRIVI